MGFIMLAKGTQKEQTERGCNNERARTGRQAFADFPRAWERGTAEAFERWRNHDSTQEFAVSSEGKRMRAAEIIRRRHARKQKIRHMAKLRRKERAAKRIKD